MKKSLDKIFIFLSLSKESTSLHCSFLNIVKLGYSFSILCGEVHLEILMLSWQNRNETVMVTVYFFE